MTAARFAEICQVGDRFLRERLSITVAIGGGFTYRRPEPPSRSDFDAALDDFAYDECRGWPASEILVLAKYTEAAAGVRPLPRIEVSG